MWQQSTLAPDMILLNNSVNLENGRQHVNSINRKILKPRKLSTVPGQENNFNSTGVNPVSSKINGKVSHLIGQKQVPEFLSGLKRKQKDAAQANTN